MTKKYISISIILLAVLPLLVVIFTYSNIPIIITNTTNVYTSSSETLIKITKINEVITYLQEKQILTIKVISVIISLYPIYILVVYFIKNKTHDKYNKMLLQYYTFYKIIYTDIIALILYATLFDLITNGLQTLLILISCYYIISALITSILPVNNVVGFHSRYTKNLNVFKLTNKIYSVFLFILAGLFLIVPIISEMVVLAFISVLLISMLFYIITYIFSYIFYRAEKVEDEKIYKEIN